MKHSLLLALLSVALIHPQPTHAQAPHPTLASQFDEVASDMTTVDDFRMMKAYKVENFWKAVQDSMHQQDARLQDGLARENKLKETLSKQKERLDQKADDLSDLEFTSAHIAVFGASFPKTVFLVAVGVIIGGLVAIIVMLITSNKVMYSNKKEMALQYANVSAEFEHYKHNAIEKEIKLSRELLNFRNRLEALSDETAVHQHK